MSSPSQSRGWKALLLRYETLLLLVLLAEWLFFYFAGTTTNRRGVVVGFGTLDRQFDILRHSCEIGLLAVAPAPFQADDEADRQRGGDRRAHRRTELGRLHPPRRDRRRMAQHAGRRLPRPRDRPPRDRT